MNEREHFYATASAWLIGLAMAVGSLSHLFCASAHAASEANPKEAAAGVEYNKLALLVGINDYKHVSKLKGALNDLENIKMLLIERFGFPNDDQHIVVLKDKQATRDAILRCIKDHLIAKATPDSIVLFQFSGHGSQKVDDNGDETDGYDETLVTYDSGHQDPYPNRDITDDELFGLLNELTDKTPNVTFLFDSCHSGTTTRGAGLARTVDRDNRPPPGQRRAPSALARGLDEGKSGLHPANSRFVLISGCAAAEYSYELEIGGKPYGALTWHFADQIRRAGANSTYQDIMDLVKTCVTATYPVQHPQLEGLGEDRLIFSHRSTATAPYVLVKDCLGGTLTLEAGQVHGVTKGSIYDVHPPGTKSFGADARPIAQAEITEVDVTTSTATVLGGKTVGDASRAVERKHRWPDAVLRVCFMLDAPARPEATASQTLLKIKGELDKFHHITTAPTASGYDLLLREQFDEKTGKSYIITESGDPTEVSPRVAMTDPDAVSHVVSQVTHWAKWFNLLRICNRQPALGLEFELNPENGLKKATSGSSDHEVGLTLFEGEKFTIRIANRSRTNLYFNLIDLSSNGSVDVVYPEPGVREFLAPGNAWTMVLKTFVPEGNDSVRDVLKVIATTQFADFRFLRQAAVRGGPRLTATRGETNALEELLANAAVGTTRGITRVEVGAWTTVDKVLDVRRRK